MITIDNKIVSSEVVKTDTLKAKVKPDLQILNENMCRPEELQGTTYKLKPPVAEHAFYVTINDVILNAGTENEERRPFEMFINTKNTESYQWITALTRLISAVFRKGGGFDFVVDELMSTFDPHGGYFLPGGKGMCPSIVAEIGRTLKTHIAKTKAKVSKPLVDLPKTKKSTGQICPSCNQPALKVSEGCVQCLECAYSKCG